MSYLVVNPDNVFRIFQFEPERCNAPITKPADYVEEDEWGHVYHPEIPTGEIREFWAYKYYAPHSTYISYDEGSIIDKSALSYELQGLTWKDEPWDLEKPVIDKGLDNNILDEMTWRCDTPSLIHEIQSCSGIGLYTPVLNIFLSILACLAKRASEINDPILNICMLKLKLYEVEHKKINDLIKGQLNRIKRED